LTVQVEELSPVVRRLSINVPAARVDKVTDLVYRRLGQTVKLKGFRTGHVPRRVLEKYLADQVKTDVARKVVETTFPEALGTTQLSPVAEPTIEPEEFKQGEAFKYSARVEVRPTVTVNEYKGLEVTVAERKVPEEAVDARLNEIRDQMADLVPLEGREEAQMGDYATVDYEVTIEGRKPQTRDGGLIQLEPGLFLSGNGEKLAGQKIGETREFDESFPTDRTDELKGKSAHVKVKVTGLKHRQVPALDDELAKERGSESLAALRAELRTELETQAAEARKAATRAALIDRLIEKNPVEVPPALVDSTAHRLAHDILRNFSNRGIELPGGHELVDRLKIDALPRATIDVKSYFLLDAVAKAENIQVTPEELEKKFEDIAAEEGTPVAKVKTRYRTAESVVGLNGVIRNEKAMAIVEESAKVLVQPETPKAETESGAAT
jgi:trigger factor